MTFAFKYIKTPPGNWEIEVTKPAVWAGRFRSQDGVAWWSPALDRPLGEHHNNPGETRVLANLRTAAARHIDTKRGAVIDAARGVVMASDAEGGQPWPGVDTIRKALNELDSVEGRPG